ncbi:tyrosine-type recombinase/integrase [Streptomyces chartreusis]
MWGRRYVGQCLRRQLPARAPLFTDHGRPVNASRIEAAVRNATERAGLGRVTPHQLRHTLATQAINRGMSLEAIAASLDTSRCP